jgi:hypothetical protein
MGIPYVSVRIKENKKPVSAEVLEDVLKDFKKAVDSLYTTKIKFASRVEDIGVELGGVEDIDAINDKLTQIESCLEKIKYYTNYTKNIYFEKVEKNINELREANTIHKLYRISGIFLPLSIPSVAFLMAGGVCIAIGAPLPNYVIPITSLPIIILSLSYLIGKVLAEEWYKARNELYKIRDLFIQEVKRY